MWTALFKTNTEELGKAMRPNSPLRLSGMLMGAGRRVQIARVSEFWIDLIAGGESVFDSLLEPFDDKVGSGRPARLLEEDRVLATEILKNDTEPGVNLLLYGAPSLEKRQLLRDVIGKSGRQAFRVRRQGIALDTQLSAEEWLDQLQIECDIKNAPRRVRPHQ